MKTYLKSLGSFSIGPIIGAFFSFITIPTITYYISPEEYGRVSMFTLLQNILGMIVYLGMDQSYVKFYNEIDNKNKLMIHAITPPLITSILVSVLIYIFRYPLSQWLYGATNELECVLILIPYLPFFVLERFVLVRFRMAQRGVVYSVFSIVNKAFLLILSIFFLKYIHCGFESVIYATVLAQVAGTLIMCIIYIKEEGIQTSKFDYKLTINLLKFGIPLVPATLVGWVLNSMDKIMIRSICNYEQLGLYSAALKIVSVLAIIQSCFATFWSPIAFGWNQEGKKIERYEKVGRIISILMIVIFMFILTFKEIIINILSPEYYSAVKTLPFLLIYPIMYTISEVTVVGIYFSGKSFNTIIIAVCACITNIFLNSILIPTYGSVGASIATGISYIIFFWLRTLISMKVWKKFSVGYYVYITFLIIGVSFFNVLFDGWIAVTINFLILIAFLYLNKNTINYCFDRLRS